MDLLKSSDDWTDANSINQWFSNFHEPWSSSKFNRRILKCIVTLWLCNVTAKLLSEGLCPWPQRTTSWPQGGRGPRLRNPAINHLSGHFDQTEIVFLIQSKPCGDKIQSKADYWNNERKQ